MKKIFVLVFLLLNVLSHAQNNYSTGISSNLNQSTAEKCGYDKILNAMSADSATAATLEQKRAAIRNHISTMLNTQNMGMRQQTNTYVIPVAVHLIGTTTSAAIADADVVALINLLNDAFSNSL